MKVARSIKVLKTGKKLSAKQLQPIKTWFARQAYENKAYIDTYFPEHPEVIRNLPVRHPAIWLINQ